VRGGVGLAGLVLPELRLLRPEPRQLRGWAVLSAVSCAVATAAVAEAERVDEASQEAPVVYVHPVPLAVVQ
jgi:hypothetical protein